ncbi:hypothetical protein G3I59_46280 [Amycolatopsis rubida]|uniref:Uncharacterized protein n=1 Tax=Amycolatopsis rubida TaxID=112413 RepID=A0A1I5ZRL1_9PSEU|nr:MULTISPECIES: hypothetical protein [Amycolatopsis]MYW97830.1 hypothetical protein [Amycolatopsis rubida]NEC62816.1 hypothetical protein [Amycolatopsis rubida]OAP24048.1 hypothetical protein A4R44_05203 [Amycolatopsis sp. M39]SFQ59114.1 hypothetical protein SAMN05421854_11653 [Amycolatopsis rubida]
MTQPPQPYPGMEPQQYSPLPPAYGGQPAHSGQFPAQPPPTAYFGATAIAAATLASVIGLVGTIGFVVAVIRMVGHPSSGRLLSSGIAGVVDLAIAALTVAGAIGLFRRSPAGRICVLAGGGLAVLDIVVFMIVGLGSSFVRRSAPPTLQMTFPSGFLWLIVPVAALVLAAHRATGAWLLRKTRPAPYHPGW